MVELDGSERTSTQSPHPIEKEILATVVNDLPKAVAKIHPAVRKPKSQVSYLLVQALSMVPLCSL